MHAYFGSCKQFWKYPKCVELSFYLKEFFVLKLILQCPNFFLLNQGSP